MADIKDDIMRMVRKELEKDPDIENQRLYEKAKEIDGSIGDLTLRQFHARYPLQVKRQKAQQSRGRKKKKQKGKTASRKATGGGRKRGGEGAVDRDRVRATLLRFAKEVSSASDKAEMIDLITNVDEYVDEVEEAVAGR